MKMLTRNDIPCWYELSWAPNSPAIIVRVHQDFIAANRMTHPDNPHVKALMDVFSFTEFNWGYEDDFGFQRSFKRIGEHDSFIEFMAVLPPVRKETGKKCRNCNGSKRDKILQGRCLYCDGTGKEEIRDLNSAYAVSATFTVFTQHARFPEQETTATIPQLLTVQTTTLRNAHGGELFGEYSIPLCEWLKRLGEEVVITEMVKAMRIAHRRMLGRSDIYAASSFWASVKRNGWLNVSCPGGGCGLSPSESPKYGCGCRFSSHNVDTPMQQLTLLAGLAALHDRARRELAES